MNTYIENGVPRRQIIKLEGVQKAYETSAGEFVALRDINLSIKTGEFATVIGKSGSGKSTLLNIIAGIDRATAGEVVVGGTSLNGLSENQLAIWRGKTVGVIFQFFQLLPTLTVAENVMLPMDFGRFLNGNKRKQRALDLLERVGIVGQAHKLPHTLSGGQQQRVAIARALANDPPILVADEPTGNLDTHTAEVVLNLFSALVNEGKTILMVTHERDIETRSHRLISLEDGRILVDGAGQKELKDALPTLA
ncbi:MAG: ABC transporter ATP-binding protein [Chloroflexi bacterium]|nr:ABC transporter ATP-binding protein [Chloroflexota bacterium]